MDEKWIWWKHGVIYQIYPRSFYDSNGDGVGDIPGIIEKLDYLEELGIDGIWISPINISPMYDFGYDVSDYYDIDPVFGTLDDFKKLIGESHKRGIRIMMDLVLNHTSHLHSWFIESRSSRNNPKRDWYIWHPGYEKKPPNNWESSFGGTAWKFDETTGEYYLHSFLEEQPDLNWNNRDMKNDMFGMVRYWLDMGVDGFRLDVVNFLIKDKLIRNNPGSLLPGLFRNHKFDRNRPEVHELMKEFRSILDSYNERIAVGEVFNLPPSPKMSADFLGNGTDELHLAFDFSLMYRFWSARAFYKAVRRWMKAVPEDGWPCHVLSNHDQPRSRGRYDRGKDGMKRAMVAMTLLMTLRGTPFLYYGEELGMQNNKIKRDEIIDPAGKRFWPLYQGRDPSRTPMQWSPHSNAGFTTGRSWLPVCSDYVTINVESEKDDDYSLLNFVKKLVKIRKENPALHRGEWVRVIKGHGGIIAYYRRYADQEIFVALNFTARERSLRSHNRGQWKVILSTHRSADCHLTDIRMTLAPYEATIVEKIGTL